jgi:hypothetical protein
MSDKASKRERFIAALLSEPTHEAAAAKAGVSSATLRRALNDPGFRAAYRRARRELLRAAIERLQAGVGQAVDTLAAIAKDGSKDGDRVRAAVAILDHAFLGLDLRDVEPAELPAIAGTADVVRLLADRLSQLDAAELPAVERARLTATLADAMLRAYGVDVIDKRLEALQDVLSKREDAK